MAEQEGVQENVSQEQVSEQPQEQQTKPEAKPESQKPEGYIPETEANSRAAAARREAEAQARASAERDLAESLGVSVEEAKGIIQAHQEREEASKSELEKAAQRLKKTQEERQQAQMELEKERDARLSLQKEYALRDSLRDAGINGERISLALMVADTDSLSVIDEGQIEGLEDVVNALQEASPEWFGNTQRTRLVSPDARQQERQPVGIQDMSKEDFNRLYDEAIRGGHVTLPPAN